MPLSLCDAVFYIDTLEIRSEYFTQGAIQVLRSTSGGSIRIGSDKRNKDACPNVLSIIRWHEGDQFPKNRVT